MKCAVVILNWNGLQHLQHYLPRVVATTHDADIVVADNGSTDGSVEWLRGENPQVRLVLLDKNYGFAGGYNRALAPSFLICSAMGGCSICKSITQSIALSSFFVNLL